MKKNTAYCIGLFMFLSFYAIAQNFKVSGYVLDSTSNEVLGYANICHISTQKCSDSNDFGYYSLNELRGNTMIEVSYLGYFLKKMTIEITKDTIIDFKLIPLGQQLQEVQVTDYHKIVNHGVVALPIEKLKSIPSIAGEADVIKALAFLPGVQAGVEGTTGLYVRGGTPDQNLVLLDGATVYNTSHLFGFLSVFNPNVLKSLTFYKGNFPARYGGRLSSIIDISMREGNNKKKESEFSIGTISTNFSTEGPIVKNKSSYIFSGRTAYLGLLALPSYIAYKNGNKDDYQNFLMYDFNGKVNFELSKKDKIFMSIYTGRDRWNYKENSSSQVANNLLSWGNTTGTIRHTKIIKPNLFLSTMLNFNSFDYSSFIENQDTSTKTSILYSSVSSVKDGLLKVNLDWQQNKQFLKFGFEFGRHQFNPQLTSIKIEAQAQDSTVQKANQIQQPKSFSFYIDDEIQFNPSFRAKIGFRFASYLVEKRAFNSFEPRIALNYRFNTTSSIELAYAKMQQPIHLLSNSNIGFANDIWVPATQKTVPQQGQQISLGYSFGLKSIDAAFQIDLFYKSMKNQIDYRQGINFFFDIKDGWENLVEKNGIGRAAGIEMLVQKQEDNRNFIFSYTFSYSYRKFTNINKGKWYPQRYDRRHNLSVLYEQELANPKWKFFSNFVFMTGNAVTLPTAAHYDLFFEEIREVYETRNNKRMPIYNRFDVGLTKSYKTKRNRDAKLSFNIYNIYAYPNAMALNYVSHTTSLNGSSYSFNPQIYKVSLFRFIPGFSYNLKLK